MRNINIRSNVRKRRGGCNNLSSPRVSGVRRKRARERVPHDAQGRGFEITRVRREEKGGHSTGLCCATGLGRSMITMLGSRNAI